jgi:hypothetical protein
MPKKSADWDALREAFVVDPECPTVREFAQRLGLVVRTAQNRASYEDWVGKREAYRAKIGNKTHEILAARRAETQADDYTKLLEQIGLGRDKALKKVLEGDYDNSGEAVLAVDRLTKLERLLLGESTENIKVDDMRAGVSRLVESIRRKFGDEAVAELADEFAAAIGSSQSHTA